MRVGTHPARALLAVAFAGCSTSSGPATPSGTYAATTSGHVSTSFEGEARASEIGPGVVSIDLLPPEDGRALWITIRFTDGRPRPGTYPVGGPLPSATATLTAPTAGELLPWNGESGTIRVTSSSAEGIAGTGDFVGTNNGRSIRVVVRFSAAGFEP